MNIVCPNCKASFSFDETRVSDQSLKLRCGKCKAVFKVSRKVADATASSETPSVGDNKCNKLFVANESPSFCSAVQKVLTGEPFEVITFNDGLAAMKAIEAEKPAVVLLDVALPSMYGFEICEAVRRNQELDNVRIILVASIYDKTRYKRTPSSLYGADAYIEKHHIPDSLAALLKKLVSGGVEREKISSNSGVADLAAFAREKTSDPQILEGEESAKEELRRDEELTTKVTSVPLSGDSSDKCSDLGIKAKRLARIIVSDILLYNQDKVKEGIRTGTLHELLRDEIREGQSLYARRVPKEVAEGSNFLNDAFEQLISNKRRELGL